MKLSELPIALTSPAEQASPGPCTITPNPKEPPTPRPRMSFGRWAGAMTLAALIAETAPPSESILVLIAGWIAALLISLPSPIE
jgi:hypothetical protein